MEIHIGDRVAEIELVSKEDNKVVLTIDGKPFEADVVMAENGTCNILMDGRSANAQLIRRENGKSYKVNTHYSSFNVEIVDSQAKYLRMRKKGEDVFIGSFKESSRIRSFTCSGSAISFCSTTSFRIGQHSVSVR